MMCIKTCQSVLSIDPTMTVTMTVTTVSSPTARVKIMTKQKRPRDPGDSMTFVSVLNGIWLIAA